jgi:glycosyltransferase involved in cell wall biosynthesis
VVSYITVDSTKTGVGRYAFDLYNLMLPDAKIIQIIFNKKFKDSAFQNPVMGHNLYQLNYIFTKHIYSDIIKKINNSTDIIHITSHTIKPVFKNKRGVITLHDLIPFKRRYAIKGVISSFKDSQLRKYIKEYLQWENVITVSNYVKNDIIGKFNVNEDKITVISPYISNSFFPIGDKSKLREEFNLPVDKKLILSISSTDPRKNLKMVYNISKRLGDEFKLVRVGEPLGDSISYKNLDIVKLNKLYNACDVLIFPSYEEGFGYPVLEAMKSGLPVVASDIPVVKENAGKSALLADPDDLDANIEAIYKAIENKDFYIKKGIENAEKYSPGIIRDKLVQYYRNIKE